MAENTLSVLKIAPGQHPQQVEIDNDLKALQQAVGGSIGASYPFADPVAIVYNDDGKLMGLPLNRALRDENGQMYDAVAGDFLVVGLGEEDFASLIPEMAQKYEQLFHQPEVFLKLGNRLLVLPVAPIIVYWSLAIISSADIPLASSFFNTDSASAFLDSSAAFFSAATFFASALERSFVATFNADFLLFSWSFSALMLSDSAAISVSICSLAAVFSATIAA